IFFPPCKPSRSETYVSASVKEIDYARLGIVNQAELKLQPRAFFRLCTTANTEAPFDWHTLGMNQSSHVNKKFARKFPTGKLRLLDNDGTPLVPAGIVKSDSEVEVVFDETANLRISTSDKDESDKDSPDDEEDTRSGHEYLKDLKEEYQTKALLAKSKRLFKKGTQRFRSAKATDHTECHKCGKKCHFTRDCWSKTSVPLYQSPFESKLLHSSKNKPKIRNTKYFEAKYNKVKAKLALSVLVPQLPVHSQARTKVSLLNHMIEMKKMYHLMMKKMKSKLSWHLLMKKELETCINEQIPTQKKKILRIDMSITSSNLHKSYEAEDSTLPNHNTVEVPSNNSQRNTNDPLTVVSDSPASDYDLADESSVCSTHLLPLKKLDGAEPSSRPKTVK
nr:hypothetical protein [Tanacetum cinerariifolium]